MCWLFLLVPCGAPPETNLTGHRQVTTCMTWLHSPTAAVLNMPMVNKQLSMWAESLATLLMVHHYGHPTYALTELRHRLRRLHIHPNMYTFTHFSQTNAVYWKQRVELRPDLPHSVNPQSDVYIGSTSITYSSREHNRRAKLLGIQHGQFINAEPALRWWHHFGNYDE